MDNLPIPPFEKMLSYLSLKERIKLRAVCRGWCRTIDSFKIKQLLISSDLPEKTSPRLARGVFAQNFLRCKGSYPEILGSSIFSDLKQLRLLGLHNLNIERFAETLNLWVRLEELTIIDTEIECDRDVKVNLPMLRSLRFDINYDEFDPPSGTLILDAPRLQNVRLSKYEGLLKFVHAESIEKLITRFVRNTTNLINLKNLKHLHCALKRIDPNFLADMPQLKQINVVFSQDERIFLELLEQKNKFGRADLKIAHNGFLIDPANPSSYWKGWYLDKPQLIDEVPYFVWIAYKRFESWDNHLAVRIFRRLTDLSGIYVYEKVQDVERLLNFLRDFDILGLEFDYDVQPQNLFDRLPDYCAVRRLVLEYPIPDLSFLLRLRHLISLKVSWEVELELIRRVFNELQFISSFEFKFPENSFIKRLSDKSFKLGITNSDSSRNFPTVPDIDAAIHCLYSRRKNEKGHILSK